MSAGSGGETIRAALLRGCHRCGNDMHDLTAGETAIDAEHRADCRKCAALAGLDALLAALAAAEEARDEALRQGLGREPNEDGGPGHEETYWLRRKLDASIRHLRDVEDFYRLRGGLPLGFNTIRADRARDLYEAITEDFVNGNVRRSTRAELEAERDRAQEALRCITSPRSGHLSRDALRGIARAALAAGGREPTLTEPEDPSRESPGATAGDLSPSRGRSPSGSVSAGGREPGQATAGGGE